MTVDPITLEIIQNKLLTNVSQITHRLVRAAYSFMIKEMEDCSASLFDAECRLLAESANIPIHLNCIGVCLRAILDNHIPAQDWEPGDVILTNDPYLGGGSLGSAHTNDLVMYAPVFQNERLVGFAGVMAHHFDIGAASSGTRGWNVEIFQEGLLIPPVKLKARGKSNSAVVDLILRNCRMPRTLRNDLLAQLTSLTAGAEELAEIFSDYGTEVMEDAAIKIIEHGEKRSRQKIRAIPDGVYKGEMPILDDGFAEGPHYIRLKINKSGSDIEFDFSGTDPQIRGPVNAPLSTTMSAIYYVMRCLTDSSIPNSEGTKLPIRVIAPEGTLVNARPPAAVYQRMVTCHALVDLVMGTLADVVPDRVMAASCGCQYNYASSYDSESGEWIGFGEVTPGGLGATRELDGIDVMSCHVTNCAMPPMEVTEIEAPVLFLQREFQVDTGGAGRRRGGVGQTVTYQVLAEDVEFTRTSQKAKIRPGGFQGGRSGMGGTWVINQGKKDERKLKYAMGDTIHLNRGDTVTFNTTSGGGFGDPKMRERALVRADLRDGFISEKAATEIYGFANEPKATEPAEH